MFAAQGGESRVAKALVARLDRVTERDRSELRREKPQESGNVLAVELPPRCQHPQGRAQLRLQTLHALRIEIADPFAGIG